MPMTDDADVKLCKDVVSLLEEIERELTEIGGVGCYKVFRKVRCLRQKLDGTFVDVEKHPERDAPEDCWVGNK